MTLDEIRNISAGDIIRWPVKTKILSVFILVVVLGIVVWFEFIAGVNSKYHAEQQLAVNLRKKITSDRVIAATLPAYQNQIKEMNARFRKFLEQLPNKSQIPSLLDSVTAAGSKQGLRFSLFQPTQELTKNFYVEIPVNLSVVGSYSALGEFAASVAAMPRIVTMNNVQIHRLKNTAKTPYAMAKSQQKLEMQCTLTTYRYKKASKGTKR